MKNRDKRILINTLLRKAKNVCIAMLVVAWWGVPFLHNLKLTATIFILTFITDLIWEKYCNNKLIKDFKNSKKHPGR